MTFSLDVVADLISDLIQFQTGNAVVHSAPRSNSGQKQKITHPPCVRIYTQGNGCFIGDNDVGHTYLLYLPGKLRSMFSNFNANIFRLRKKSQRLPASFSSRSTVLHSAEWSSQITQ